jgi:hypothetical protein
MHNGILVGNVRKASFGEQERKWEGIFKQIYVVKI